MHTRVRGENVCLCVQVYCQLYSLLMTYVYATSARILDASQSAISCLDHPSVSGWAAEGTWEIIRATILPSKPQGPRMPLMAHIDEKHSHRRQGGRHTAILHRAPQSELITEHFSETPLVVSWKWWDEQLPRDRGDRIENETLPRQSDNLRDLEEPIPECKNSPWGAKVTTLLSHLFQECKILSSDSILSSFIIKAIC